jgi:hypothetical protein
MAGMRESAPVLDLLRSMPNGVRIILLFGFVLLAAVGLTLPLVVQQAVEAPISAFGLLWMLLLAYLVFTLTLILQRKQAAWMLSFGLATLSVPLSAVLFFWAGAIGLAVGAALAVVLFLALRGQAVRAWFSEQ